MNEAQAARFLIERVTTGPDPLRQATGQGLGASRMQPSQGIDQKAEVLANRIFLKIFSVPSLQSFLADASVRPTGEPGGKVRIELDFLKLPKEILPDLEKLLSLDWFKDAKLMQYVKNGQGRTGIRIEVDPRNLPGDAIDYAF